MASSSTSLFSSIASLFHPTPLAPPPPAADPHGLATLKLATFNVWFDGIAQTDRAHLLLSLLQSEHPDVVCLQEVTNHFLDVLRVDPWWTKHYVLTDKAFKEIGNWYGIITLVRKDTLEIVSDEAVRFPRTKMGRCLHVLELRGRPRGPGVEGLPTFRLAQSHFESMNNIDVRLEQLKVAAARVGPPPPSYEDTATGPTHVAGFILGDTNCYNASESQRLEDVGFRDVWTCLHPDDPGHTYGLTFGVRKDHLSRIDRIGWNGDGFRALEVRRIGMEGVEVDRFGKKLPEGAVLHASDHVGLVATFEYGGSVEAESDSGKK
ncbi:hypothetical protein HDU96_009786 [Phlyctochytrium bullatum]|nr:hypothetical protein HDU96_009786 [Phlyctochytrium bullatum]